MDARAGGGEILETQIHHLPATLDAIEPSPSASIACVPLCIDDAPSLRENASNFAIFLAACAECTLGMTLFNLGLVYGFTDVGRQLGETLPSAFLRTDDERSPRYPFVSGVLIVSSVLFFLGLFATRAEPAVQILGAAVERVLLGRVKATTLVTFVCVGVGLGMMTGALKILFGVPVVYFILAKYAVAWLLTLVASETMTLAGWDSGAVTTGDVTVPFVLSIGIGFSRAVGTQEGFGILMSASVLPIITVLLTDPLQAALALCRRKCGCGGPPISSSGPAGGASSA